MTTLVPPRTWLAIAAVLLAATAAVMWPRTARAQTDVHVFWPVGSGRSAFEDLDEDGLDLGDRLTGRGPIVDASDVQVGHGHLDCVVMRRITDGPEDSRGLYRCSYLLRLADGDLIVEGLDPHGPGQYTMAVLGGTGGFAGASGDATLTDSFAGTEFVIRLGS